MKFLITTRRKDLFLTLPPEMRVQVLEGMVAFVDKYRKAGKCKEIYYHGDMKGSISIWEIDSGEEGARLTFENPLSPFMDIEMQPIVEWDPAVKALRESLAKLPKK